MAKWRQLENDKDPGHFGVEPLFEPKCRTHDVPLMRICWKLLSFKLDDISGEKIPHEDCDAYAMDVEMVCPRCGWWRVFGVAIDKEKHEYLLGRVNERKENRASPVH